METKSIQFSNTYTPSTSGVGGALPLESEFEVKETQQPAIMINLYVELMMQDTDNQSDIEREFLKRLIEFSKTDQNMKISIVKKPRDYYDCELINV